MAQQDIFEIFEDCTQRLATGQSIEDCLRLYPQYAGRLRPMLETTQITTSIEFPMDEVLEDQALVWQAIEAQIPLRLMNQPQRRINIRVQLLVAVILFLLLTTMVWFILTRPDLPKDDDLTVPIVETMTFTPTVTETRQPSPTSTITPTQTTTPTMMPTQTLTMTTTSTMTTTRTPIPTLTSSATAIVTLTQSITPTASITPLPTATFAPGCGAPLTEQGAIDLVLSIHPNTTITLIEQTIRFNNIPVWDVITSHGIEVIIDVACGNILTIERSTDTTESISTINDNTSSTTDGSSESNLSTSNLNINAPDDETNGNSNDNNDDNSGMGSDDSEDDNSGMGSDD